MFCGVGPFAIPSAKGKSTVFANDLNPESIKWLKENISKNRVEKNCLSYNMDAREFVPKALGDLKEKYGKSYFDHFIMNLPASAHDFLDTFRRADVLSADLISYSTIHCYVFCRSDESPLEKISISLKATIDPSQASIRRVRDVAPNKEMFCVSFKLPPSLLEESPSEGSIIDSNEYAQSNENEAKKARLE